MVRNMPGKMLDWLTTQLDLPSEPMPGKSLVEIFEDSRVVVENHYGVISYNTEEIKISENEKIELLALYPKLQFKSNSRKFMQKKAPQ